MTPSAPLPSTLLTPAATTMIACWAGCGRSCRASGMPLCPGHRSWSIAGAWAGEGSLERRSGTELPVSCLARCVARRSARRPPLQLPAVSLAGTSRRWSRPMPPTAGAARRERRSSPWRRSSGLRTRSVLAMLCCRVRWAACLPGGSRQCAESCYQWQRSSTVHELLGICGSCCRLPSASRRSGSVWLPPMYLYM